MTRDDALAILTANRDELLRRGVVHAGLFGSTARGEAGPKSDVDVLVELDPGRPIGVYEFVAIQQFVGGLFPGPVDVVHRAGLKARPRVSIERDLVHAF